MDELLEGKCPAWKSFKSDETDMVETCVNLEHSDDPRPKALMKEYNIRGALCIFRDGAVYEFGKTSPMEGRPEHVAKIGGSTGVKAAAKAVLAGAKLKGMAKKNTETAETGAEEGKAA